MSPKTIKNYSKVDRVFSGGTKGGPQNNFVRRGPSYYEPPRRGLRVILDRSEESFLTDGSSCIPAFAYLL